MNSSLSRTSTGFVARVEVGRTLEEHVVVHHRTLGQVAPHLGDLLAMRDQVDLGEPQLLAPLPVLVALGQSCVFHGYS